MKNTDVLIIGGGIMGLALARALKERRSELAITIIEKESSVAQHASGRNSGVLHAGFYYTADSLKARFTIAGNRAMRAFCRDNAIRINECGKLVVAKDESEVKGLIELDKRGRANGSEIGIIDVTEAERIEPNVRTYEKAIWSPHTATVDPKEVCQKLAQLLQAQGVEIELDNPYLSGSGDTVLTPKGQIKARKIINCAGLYADRIAHQYGFGRDYTILPFKGLYLKYTKDKALLRTNIYPVPNLKNPFLGVHFTKTVDNVIKIGPTAIPAFWREQYGPAGNFKARELFEIASWQARLFATNTFGFRDLAFEEVRKYYRPYMIGEAAKLVKTIDRKGFGELTAPGIRAQLLNKKTRMLLTDFVVEGDDKTVHVLNAVSPAFTCSFPFADWVVEKYLRL